MSLPTLADLKLHLRIRHDMEDADLQAKLDAAVDHASQYLGRPIPWASDEQSEVPVPASVRVAILMIAAELYANREQSVVSAIYTKIPVAENLMHFYRVGLGI